MSEGIYQQPSMFFMTLLVTFLVNIKFVTLSCLVCCIHRESKKLCHFYFYCNFGKCWSIFKILLMSESERNGS